MLTHNKVRPHKVRYHLERRDPDFDHKMVQIFLIYDEVELQRATGEDDSTMVISYDERPGIQTIESKAPDLPPVPGGHPMISREFEYVRHGTSSLLAGVDLTTGQVHHLMRDRHRSREFIEFLQLLDRSYPPDTKIRLILDNHSSHLFFSSLQGDERLPQNRPESLRLRLHPRPRILAQPDRNPLLQDGALGPATHPCRQQGRTLEPHRRRLR